MKILKTKRVNLVICWNGLRTTSPKDFPDITEMEKTTDILTILKAGAGDFAKIVKEGEDLQADIQSKRIPEDKAMEARTKFQQKSNEFEAKRGNDLIKIEFEDDNQRVFVKQFERWGRNWFFKLEPYLEFRKDLLGDEPTQSKEEEKK